MLTIVRILLAEHRTVITVRRETQPLISILCALRASMLLTYHDAY